MATSIDVTKAEGIIARTFNDKDMASLALTAPGAVVPGAVHSPDGNRGLALLGISVLETIALTHWHASGGDRSKFESWVIGGATLMMGRSRAADCEPSHRWLVSRRHCPADRPRCLHRSKQLTARGCSVPNPSQVDCRSAHRGRLA